MANMSVEERADFEQKIAATQIAIMQRLPRRQQIFSQSLEPMGRNQRYATVKASQPNPKHGLSINEDMCEMSVNLSNEREERDRSFMHYAKENLR